MKKAELEKLICELLDIPEVNRMIKVQISRFVTERGYDYKDIGRALYYFVEVQGNTPDKSRGIGIVPFVKDDAVKYFENEKRKQQAQNREAEKIKNGTNNKPKIKVSPKRKERGRRFIDMEDL